MPASQRTQILFYLQYVAVMDRSHEIGGHILLL